MQQQCEQGQGEGTEGVWREGHVRVLLRISLHATHRAQSQAVAARMGVLGQAACLPHASNASQMPIPSFILIPKAVHPPPGPCKHHPSPLCHHHAHLLALSALLCPAPFPSKTPFHQNTPTPPTHLVYQSRATL
jgi:hypothetical protein